MREILDAIKYWILYKLDIAETSINENRDEILYLREELKIAREEISRLTNLMYNAAVKPEIADIKEEEPEPIRGQYVPWHVRRAKLEREDKLKAEAIRKEAAAKIAPVKVQTTEELENELDLGEESNDAISNG
jgi:hypothetical protein